MDGLHSMPYMARVQWIADKHIEQFQMAWKDMLLNIAVWVTPTNTP